MCTRLSFRVRKEPGVEASVTGALYRVPNLEARYRGEGGGGAGGAVIEAVLVHAQLYSLDNLGKRSSFHLP